MLRIDVLLLPVRFEVHYFDTVSVHEHPLAHHPSSLHEVSQLTPVAAEVSQEKISIVERKVGVKLGQALPTWSFIHNVKITLIPKDLNHTREHPTSL